MTVCSEASSNLVIRLARPSRIAAGGKINPDKVDLLLVDEFTKLQVAVRNELINAGRSIPHIIAVTATPALHHSRTRSELLELLEPDAARISRAEDRSILKVLAEREDAALKRFDAELADAAQRRAIEDSYGLYRRLIRTQRTDYPDTLPRRRYQPIRVSPTDGDIERAKATRAYLEAAEAAGLDYKRDALLQVAGRTRVHGQRVRGRGRQLRCCPGRRRGDPRHLSCSATWSATRSAALYPE